VGYVTLDHLGVIREVNLTGASMLGIERSWLIGKPFGSFVAERDRRRFRQHLLKRQIGERPVTTDIELVVRGEGVIRVELSSAPVKGPKEQEVSISMALTDITERERAKDALNRANAELEARVQERTAELAKANEALIAEVAERRKT
jgi:PAS domain S-box-containing protein